MATNTSKVFIDIITQFTGTKSVKQAETSFDRLAKSIAKVVSVAAIEEFSRRSIKAFLADDAAAKQLEKTLTNLGVYFDSGVLSKYIQELQDTTGVLDDQLRPAFQSLAVATGDYTKAQDLLNTALDVSQATGKSLSSVSTALSRAYLGNFTAVSRLGAGISKAEIAAGDFNAIQEKLNKNFGGSALAAADTYAGQLRILKAALTDVQEIIGKGFVDAFADVVGEDGSATKFADSMRDAAQYVADIIGGIGVISAKLKGLPGAGFFSELLEISNSISGINLIANLGKDKRLKTASFMGASPEPAQIGYAKLAQDKKALAIAKKLSAEEKKKADAAKKAAKAAADKLKADKAAAVLNAAAKVLDVEQAQILAALGNEISQNDKDRLLLQQALLNDNAEAALKLSQKIITTQLNAIALGALNPLSGWNQNIGEVIASLIDLQRELVKVGEVALTGSQLLTADFADAVADSFDPSFDIADAETKKFLADMKALSGGSLSANPYGPESGSFRGYSGGGQGVKNAQFPDINVNVLIDPKDLTTVVTSSQQNETASGIVIGTSRINKFTGGTGL
ncbi:hypothetical protein UFOVP719_18 [uncultured Caudovirales phage]|uniref:Uncharacterized protein n=1 Tax=uncultured Caudovirales phage TaxID=2100421 RepID=A0A6J5NLF1_9CAUD|nr:hypothetical protein UFOVP719_18 [uncultured Caudovirales phage]